MKTILLAAVIAITLPPSESVAASPAEDAALIADRFVTDDYLDTVREAVLIGHARAIARALRQRAVRVTDIEKLAGLLPEELADEAVSNLRQATIDDILQRFDPDKVANVAAYLRRYPNERPYGEASHDEQAEPVPIEEWGDMMAKTLADEDFRSEIELTTFISVLFLRQIMEFSDIKADLGAPYLPAILEADSDVFVFPNRIWRKDLIRELRDAGG